MSAVLQLWSDVECNSGSIITPEGAIPPPVEAKQRLSLDQRHELTVRARRDEAWLDKVLPRRVIRVETDFGETFEWRIKSMTDGRANGKPVTEVKAEPIAVDLRDAVILRDQLSGGVTFHNLGGVNLTPAQYLDTFIIPTLADVGLTWIARGTVDSTERLDVSWDRASAMEVIDRLATRLGLEWQLRRNGSTNYLIDLVTQINSSAASVLVAEKRNIISVQRERHRSGFSTVIVPAGIKPDGSEELASIGDNSWKVSGVAKNTPSSGVDTLTLEDRQGGADPIAIDDQFNTNYVEAEDGTRHEITDCTASDGTVVISSATNFATGDDVAIRLDATGTWMVELTSPTGTTNFGRVVGTFEIGDARGERNWVKNPWTSRWSVTPESIAARVDGAQGFSATGTTLQLRNALPGHSFASGDVVLFFREAGSFSKITASGQVGSTGGISLSVASRPGVTDGSEVWAVNRNREPDSWSDVTQTVHATSEIDEAVYSVREQSLFSTQLATGEASSAGAQDWVWALSNLPTGTKIRTGDLVVKATATSQFVTVANTINPTGATASIIYGAGTPQTATAGTKIKIRRPRPSAGGRRANTLCLPHMKSDVVGPVFDSHTITVTKPTGLDKMWYSAGITIQGNSGSITPTHSRPKLQLVRATSGAVLATTYVLEAATPGEGAGTADFMFRDSITATGDERVLLRLYGLVNINRNVPQVFPLTYLRWAQIHWGKEGPVPPIEGSHANKLWQEGNRELVNRHSWQTTYDVSLRELTELWDGTPDEPNLVIGGTIRLKVPDMDIDVNVRVVDVVYDLINPSNTRVVLDTRRERITRDVAKSKPRPTFTSVTVDTGATGTVTKVSQSSEDPPTVTGSRRAVSEDESTSTGSVAVDNVTEFTLF